MERYIILNESNEVTSVRYGETAVDGEIQSDTGEIGQIKQSDGTFVKPIPPQITPQPSLEDKVNYLYYKSKGVIV